LRGVTDALGHDGPGARGASGPVVRRGADLRVGTVLIGGGRIVDVDATVATPPARAVAGAVTAGFDTLEHVSFFTADGVAADPRDHGRHRRVGCYGAPRSARCPARELPPPIARRLGAVIENWTRLHRDGARIVAGTDGGIAPMKPQPDTPGRKA
jgi:imidazolonepropionase-like amidohydrolase